MRNFDDLSEREMLALAIANEEEDGRIYADFADGLREDYPSSAKVFIEMAAEENEHRRRLIDLFVSKFGEHIPLIRRQDIRGYIAAQADLADPPARRSTRCATAPPKWSRTRSASTASPSTRTSDAAIRKLLGDLAEAEVKHEHVAADARSSAISPPRRATTRTSTRAAASSCRSSSPAWSA